MSWSDEVSNEGYDVTATVCLAHGRFVPCRKRGPHEFSSRASDVECVRYFQHMSAREARQPAPQPEYEEDTTPWYDQGLTIDDQYGDYYLHCPGFTLEPVHGDEKTELVLTACRQTFSYQTYARLGEELQRHYATVGHYQLKFKLTERNRNAEPDARENGAQ